MIENYFTSSLIKSNGKLREWFVANVKLVLVYLLVLHSGASFSQCNSETPVPFIDSTFGNLTATGSTSGICLFCSASNPGRLVDSDLNNFATASLPIGAGGSVEFRVTDTNTDYSAGKFVGYRIAPTGALTVDVLGSISIRTYLNGALKENSSGSSLLGVGLLNGTGDYVVGFTTTQDFDAIEISVGGLVGLLNSIDVYYPVIREYCAGPALDCNTYTALNLPLFPVSIEPSHTGVSGVSVATISDVDNVISSSVSDFATISFTLGVAGSASISVKDQLTNYPAGTYAGYEIENSSLVNLSALGNFSLTTYLEGVQQEVFSGNNLLVNVPLLNNTGRFKVGFVSSQSFDEVRFSINQVVGLNLGDTKVYGSIFEKFCAGPALDCNTQTAVSAPTYPVFIDGANTGIDGLVCASCSVTDTENIIDENPSNYAQINLLLSVGNSGSIAVKDQITDYPAGTFAGFTIENPALLNVNALDAITIRTYLNGVLQETKSGTSGLATVGTDLLVGTSKQTIGFISSTAFDEVKITVTNLLTVSLGSVNVYEAVFQKYCPATIECNKSYALINPAFPVTIDGTKTGIEGAVCVACAVNNANNVLTPNTTDYASIAITAGVASTASLAVVDQLSTYPAGTFAGFTINNVSNLVELDLLNSITISTYLDGILRETKNGSQLLGLTLAIPILGTGTGVYNVGFKTALPFDEVRITVGSLVGVINNIDVYGAFIETSATSGGSLVCATIVANDENGVPANGTTGATAYSNILANDTLNGVAVDPNEVVITQVSSSSPNIYLLGTDVMVAPNTPIGNYTLTYRICEVINPSNCSTATVNVLVSSGTLECNSEVPIPFTSNTFDAISATTSTTGICVPGVCGVSNINAIADANLINYATVTTAIGLGVTHNLRVTDANTDYDAGLFVGYRIAPTNGLLSLDLINSMTMRTYLDGVLRETSAGADLLNLNLLGDPTNFVVGFNTTQSFDAIEISFSSLAGVITSTNVYYPVIRNYCAGPALDCNTNTALNLPVFPVSIEGNRTGISGIGLGTVSNTENVISADASDYATINLTAGVLASGSISVKDQITNYPSGTFAGFEVENPLFVDLSLLGNITLTTYLDGVQAEQFSGNNLLLNAPVLSTAGRHKVGFVSTQSFDEVRLSINQVVGVDLGSTKVFNTVFQKFCSGSDLSCNTPAALSSPAYPYIY